MDPLLSAELCAPTLNSAVPCRVKVIECERLQRDVKEWTLFATCCSTLAASGGQCHFWLNSRCNVTHCYPFVFHQNGQSVFKNTSFLSRENTRESDTICVLCSVWKCWRCLCLLLTCMRRNLSCEKYLLICCHLHLLNSETCRSFCGPPYCAGTDRQKRKKCLWAAGNLYSDLMAATRAFCRWKDCKTFCNQFACRSFECCLASCSSVSFLGVLLFY